VIFSTAYNLLPLGVILSSGNRKELGRERSHEQGVRIECLPRTVQIMMLCEQLQYRDGDGFSQSKLAVAFNVLHPTDVSEPEDKNLDEFTDFQMQFIQHNGSIIKKKHSFYSRAHLLCFLGVRQNRFLPV
jgi:hypothetical protein